jgi:hypothetical protein
MRLRVHGRNVGARQMIARATWSAVASGLSAGALAKGEARHRFSKNGHAPREGTGFYVRKRRRRFATSNVASSAGALQNLAEFRAGHLR